MLHAALERRARRRSPFRRHPEFGLMMPGSLPRGAERAPRSRGRPGAMPQAYDRMAREVAKRFEDNFARFAPHVGDDVKAAGIHATV